MRFKTYKRLLRLTLFVCIANLIYMLVLGWIDTYDHWYFWALFISHIIFTAVLLWLLRNEWRIEP